MNGQSAFISRLPACALVLAVCAHASAESREPMAERDQDVVERRGGASAIQGQILQIDDAGVWIRTERAGSQVIPWDRVRRIGTSSEMIQADADRYAELADDLWRARTRVERGDTGLAESIFEGHSARYRGTNSETALVVAEGLLRCRLDREISQSASRALALAAALEVARLRGAGVVTPSYSNLPPALDEHTLLCPALAPVWIGPASDAEIAEIEREVAGFDARGDEVVTAMAELYLRSVRRDLAHAGAADGPRGSAARSSRHPGVELLRDLVLALEHGESGQRAARARLERRASGNDAPAGSAWIEAWARYHIGRSLLGESDELARQRGVISLAHLPARFSSSQSHLAGLAMMHMIEFHEAGGNVEAAASLRAELARRFPNHSRSDDDRSEAAHREPAEPTAFSSNVDF